MKEIKIMFYHTSHTEVMDVDRCKCRIFTTYLPLCYRFKTWVPSVCHSKRELRYIVNKFAVIFALLLY